MIAITTGRASGPWTQLQHANTTCVAPKRRVSHKANPLGKIASAPTHSSMTMSASMAS